MGRPSHFSQKGHIIALYAMSESGFNANLPGITGRRPRSVVGAAGEVFVARRLRKLGFEGAPGMPTSDATLLTGRHRSAHSAMARHKAVIKKSLARWLQPPLSSLDESLNFAAASRSATSAMSRAHNGVDINRSR